MDPLFKVEGLLGPRGTGRIQEVTFELARGEVLHVTGVSGSGKTTLLRLLARLDPAERGQMWLQGIPADRIGIEAWRRRVALVFQEPRLFPGTLEENLVWAAKHHRIDIDPGGLLRSVGLDMPLERNVKGLSGGEAKRLQLARTLAVQPEVLLLDEPTASLDERSSTTIRDLIERLTDQDLGVLFVSHDVTDRQEMGGRSLRLSHGRMVQPEGGP